MLEIVVLGDCSPEYHQRLQADVLRAKSALLYADHTIVESPIVQIVLASYMETVRRLSHAMMEIDNVSSAAAHLANILEQKGLLPSREAEFLRSPKFRASFEAIEAASSALRKGDTAFAANEHLQRFGPGAIKYYVDHLADKKDERDKRAMQELVTLTETGLVTVNTNAGEAALGAEYPDIVNSVVVELLGAMVDLFMNSTVAPSVMFSSLHRLKLMSVDLGVELPNLTANRATLAGELISSVPLFPEANVDEILDLRERLKPYLARFRRGVADLERELNQELAKVDYHAALADLRLHHVDPALEELQQAIHDEDAQSTLARATKPLASSLLGLGVTIAVGAPALTMATAVAAGLSIAAAKEFLERRASRKSMAQNRVFFLFETERRLKSLGLSYGGIA